MKYLVHDSENDDTSYHITPETNSPMTIAKKPIDDNIQTLSRSAPSKQCLLELEPKKEASKSGNQSPRDYSIYTKPTVVDLSTWNKNRLSVEGMSPSVGKKVVDRIKDYEVHRVPIVLRSGNAMKRRKSIEALHGSFKTRMLRYLSVVSSSPFDKIKFENRASEFRPPILNLDLSQVL